MQYTNYEGRPTSRPAEPRPSAPGQRAFGREIDCAPRAPRQASESELPLRGRGVERDRSGTSGRGRD